MTNLVEQLQIALMAMRQTKPLVLCLTNFVTMDFMANSLLALGSAPLMTQSMDEIEELVTISQALNINLGTLDQSFCERAMKAAQLAKAQKKPVILDPVGAGASHLRTQAAKALLPYATIIRGNASEIMALVDEKGDTKGVESSRSVNQATLAAKQLSLAPANIVVVSGPIDYLTDGSQEANIPFGSSLMPLVTGMGCTLTAVVSAFAAMESNYYQAALHATAYFSLCGQMADSKVQEPGSFRQVFIDSLFKPDWELMSQFVNQKIDYAL